MQLFYHRVERLPKLSWLALLEKNSDMVHIYHGDWVETRKGFFVEGAWDGAFEEAAFDTSYFMGTGAKIFEEKILFCTPYHIHECLNVYRYDDKVVISPSLVFLLEFTEKYLDIEYIPYQVDLLRLKLKMSNHIGAIPIQNGGEVQVFHFRNLLVGPDLRIRALQKKDSPDFGDFESYRKFLIQALERINHNAKSLRRKIRYSPISTISSGYDSAACSAIATEIGCKEAVTIKQSRGESGCTDDSGKVIGERLGLRVTEFDRLEYMNKPFSEAEFVASGDLGQDFVYTAFEDAWVQKLVIIGTHGDRIWSRHSKNVTRDIIRPTASGCCLTDFKFRVGFIYVPLPYIGCLSHPSIHKITTSKEMEPWYTWNKYDRPIPRRIVEEKGVERSAFGQKKNAITVLLNRHNGMLALMNPESAKSFEHFYRSKKDIRRKAKQTYFDLMFKGYSLYAKSLGRVSKMFQQRWGPFQLPMLIALKYTQCPQRPSFLVHWGIANVRKRYKL